MNRPASTRLATRRLISQVLAKRHAIDARALAARRWVGDSPVSVRRDAVSGTVATDWSVSAQPAELLQASLEDSVLGRLNVRAVPLRMPVLAPDGSLTAGWVSESKAIPAGSIGATATAPEPRKLAVIVPATLESFEAEDSRVERIIERDVRRAMTRALDQALLDPNGDGSGDAPQAITNGVPSVSGSGDPVADLLALAAAFPGRLERASLVCDARTALELALWADSSGAARFLDCGPRGGSAATLPLIVSGDAPRDSSGGVLCLVDGEGVAAAIEDVEFTSTNETLIEQNTAPQGASDTPGAASATTIATFQNELVAIKAILRCNWARLLPCVAVCVGASYA